MREISRRTMLRGIGTSIALPLLDIMSTEVGANAGSRTRVDDDAQPPQRVVFCYIPNGVIGDRWFPTQVGKDFDLPATLKPLADHQDELLVISGLDRTYQAGADPHAQCGSCWLTKSPPNEQLDGLIPINTTLDQVIASSIGKDTAYPSLELSCNSHSDNREPKPFDAISWYGPGSEAPAEKNPMWVFRRLFGNATPFNRSVLDTVLEDANALNRNLGRNDRRKLDEYLESVRAIEGRITRAAQFKATRPEVDYPAPAGIPEDRGEYIRTMFDLLFLALKTDQTRVASVMIGPERWRTPQMYHGLFDKPVSHHTMTHDHEYDEEVAKIDHFHAVQFAHFLQKLKEEQEGERRLLDRTLVVFGSGLGDGNLHSYKRLPILLAGSNRTLIETGRHVQCAPGTPLANLWVSVAQKMGLDMERFADSDGPIREIG